ncbi:MAG: hypothetical protein N2595_04410 [bacterium]|nr:hypothetical protein [bacterium]
MAAEGRASTVGFLRVDERGTEILGYRLIGVLSVPAGIHGWQVLQIGCVIGLIL